MPDPIEIDALENDALRTDALESGTVRGQHSGDSV